MSSENATPAIFVNMRPVKAFAPGSTALKLSFGSAVKPTVAVWPSVMPSVTLMARYVTDSTTLSHTENVTTPLALEGPLGAEMFELPARAASDTVLPDTGLLAASRIVTVTVDVENPSAGTDVGLAVTVELSTKAKTVTPLTSVNVALGLVVQPAA